MSNVATEPTVSPGTDYFRDDVAADVGVVFLASRRIGSADQFIG
jgi:hypothetical protein